MPNHSPTLRKHLLQPLHDIKGFHQEIFSSLSTITKFIRLTNRFIDPDNLGLPKVTCAQVLWHHSWLAPLLPSGRSLLRSPLQLFTRDRQSLFDTIFSWALQSPAPFQRIEMFALLFSDLWKIQIENAHMHYMWLVGPKLFFKGDLGFSNILLTLIALLEIQGSLPLAEPTPPLTLPRIASQPLRQHSGGEDHLSFSQAIGDTSNARAQPPICFSARQVDWPVFDPEYVGPIIQQLNDLIATPAFIQFKVKR